MNKVLVKSIRKNIIFIFVTVVLVFIIASLFKSSAYSMEHTKCNGTMESYYRTIEKEYVDKVRDFLNKQGYSNAGVSLNRVINVDGTREYTLNIHHRRFGKDNFIKEEFEKAIEYIDFQIPNSSIKVMTTA